VRRHIGLPNSLTGFSPVRATLEDGVLVIQLKEEQ
jgi:ArsA-like protein with HSP20 domain